MQHMTSCDLWRLAPVEAPAGIDCSHAQSLSAAVNKLCQHVLRHKDVLQKLQELCVAVQAAPPCYTLPQYISCLRQAHVRPVRVMHGMQLDVIPPNFVGNTCLICPWTVPLFMKVDKGPCQLLQLDQAELGLTICPPIRAAAEASAHHMYAQEEHYLQALVAAKPPFNGPMTCMLCIRWARPAVMRKLALPLLCQRGRRDTTNKFVAVATWI